MTRDEIERYLLAGRSHSVVVDVKEIPEAPGNLRTITIHKGNSVTIEIEYARAYTDHDFEGGGPKFIATYDNLDDLIRDLEDYLETPLNDWRNFSANPYTPHILDEPDPDKNLKYFEDLLRTKNFDLPRGRSYRVASIYWRHIAKYGEYRKDKEMEEQEEELAE